MPNQDENRAIICGRLGKDSETRFTGTGKAITSFSVATGGRRESDGKAAIPPDWHNVVYWGEFMASKGQRVKVEGPIRYRSWEKDGVKRYVTEIVCWDAPVVVEDDRAAGQPRAHRPAGRDVPPGGWPVDAVISDEDVPFRA